MISRLTAALHADRRVIAPLALTVLALAAAGCGGGGGGGGETGGKTGTDQQGDKGAPSTAPKEPGQVGDAIKDVRDHRLLADPGAHLGHAGAAGQARARGAPDGRREPREGRRREARQQACRGGHDPVGPEGRRQAARPPAATACACAPATTSRGRSRSPSPARRSGDARREPARGDLDRLGVAVDERRSAGRAAARDRRRASPSRRRSPGTSRRGATTRRPGGGRRPRASASGSRSSRAPVVGTIVCQKTSVGSLPRAAFSGRDQAGRHVGLAVDGVGVEVVARRSRARRRGSCRAWPASAGAACRRSRRPR